MPLMVVTILELDYWNTFEKHDSLLQKSMVLAHAGSQRLCKTRRIRPRVFQNTSTLRLHA